MYVLIAKFTCLCHEGLPKSKHGRVVRGLLDSIRSRWKCSAQRVDHRESIHDFSIGVCFVLSNGSPSVRTSFAKAAVDFIERKGEVEVQDCHCKVVDLHHLE